MKKKIETAIEAFTSGDITENALALFKTMGYNTSRQAPFEQKDFEYFKEYYLDQSVSFNQEKAMVPHWKHIDLLFQLSKHEIDRQNPKFEIKKIDRTIIEAYLFFAIELQKDTCSRTDLSRITREINKVFAMPAMLLFKYGDFLTLAVIDRRLSKKDEQKDVLKKVTLIKDINIKKPHRAHIEILFDLSFEPLLKAFRFTNFVELHRAWEKTLDTKELSKRFYKELFNWYLWAIQKIWFPEDHQKDINIKNPINLIRLITRIIFVWFIKEKQLVPETLFNRQAIEKILKGFDKNEKSNTYYPAILQNLFFGAMNRNIEERQFAKEGSFFENKDHYGVKNLYRHADIFSVTKEEAIKLFAGIPFLNGGLFDCLDKNNKENKISYTDGFSRNPKKQAVVPDFLFFGQEQEYDLNEFYGTKNKKYKVTGIINILDSYKFTIAENTPVEEEIALDPELLGKVFENLLASYNPETKTTARKQTGSFYTPREIVDYMVSESLKACLKQTLTDKDGNMSEQDADAALESLFEYSEKDHGLDEKQVKLLIDAIDNCKILDPACGSGAFPMGILHKLVHILHKLDPNNNQWKNRQIQNVQELIKQAENIPDTKSREHVISDLENNIEDIESSFANNEMDYGRKLFLIERCIFGVDIQPIAVQIAKLRFFISLVANQKKDDKAENLGIRSLPNLETKFVAANTLIQLDSPEQYKIQNDPEIDKLKKQLQKVRSQYFSAKIRKKKIDYQNKDKELRDQISERLLKDGWLNESAAKQLAGFDPYDQNASSSFFDPEWMFGIKDGFNIVIGNPPYVQLQSLRGTQIQQKYKNKKQGFTVYEATGDIYSLFYEKGMNLLIEQGHLCFITSNKWMRAGYGKKQRKYFVKYNPEILIDLGPGVFESSTVDTNIILIGKTENKKRTLSCTISKEKSQLSSDYIYDYVKEKGMVVSNFSEKPWFIGSSAEIALKEKIERIGKHLKEWDVKIFYGIKTGLNEAFIVDTAAKEKLCKEDPKSKEILKPILRGRDIKRYGYEWAGLWIIATFPVLHIDIDEYPAVKKYLLDFGKDRLEQAGKKLPDGMNSRKKTGNKWFETQDQIAYYQEFEKEKVVWASVGETYYCLVPKNFLILDTNYFTTSLQKWQLGVINSKLVIQYINGLDTLVGRIAYRHYKYNFEKLPIPPITPQNRAAVNKIETLADKIIAAKKNSPSADTAELEKQIDDIVYKLYQLTPEEIKIVEEK